MRAFIHTLTEMDEKPGVLILYNTGVFLAVFGSECVEDLITLEKEGVKILVCGTCANYFGIKEKIKAGTISNMYEITQALFSASKIVYP